MPSPSTAKCARCQQALPAGQSFCVVCGHKNDQAAFGAKQLAVETELQKRSEQRSWLSRILGPVGLAKWIGRV